MNSGNRKTSTLLQKWHDGDGKGLDALLELHLPWIHEQVQRQLTLLLRSKEESWDFVQDAVVQFLRFGPRIMISSDGQFRALMVRIVENSLKDKYDWYTTRRRNIAHEQPLPSETVLSLDSIQESRHSPSESAERHEREAWVRLGMELLDHEDREIIVLKRWDKKTFSDIGKKLGITPDSARMRYNRAVLRLGETVLALRQGTWAIRGEKKET